MSEARFDPAPLLLVGNEQRHRLRELPPAGRDVVGLGDPGSHPDHLAERPERDAIAVGRAAALVPVDVVGEAVYVLGQFPCEPGLAYPADPGDRYEPRFPFALCGVEQLLQQTELFRPSDERRLGAGLSAGAASLADYAERPPCPDRLVLPFERELPDLLEGDRGRGGSEGGLADQDRSRFGCGLQTRGGVDEVACHDPL